MDLFTKEVSRIVWTMITMVVATNILLCFLPAVYAGILSEPYIWLPEIDGQMKFLVTLLVFRKKIIN